MVRLRVGLLAEGRGADDGFIAGDFVLDEEGVLTKLRDAALFSVESVLRRSDVEICRLTKLEPSKVILLREQLLSLTAFKPILKLPSACDRIPSDISCLDQALGGGFMVGAITQVIGKSGSGKSQLALSLCAAALLRGCQVYFIDTVGTLASTSRLFTIMKTVATSQDIPCDCSQLAHDRLKVVSVHDPWDMVLSIEQLNDRCFGEGEKEVEYSPVILIVDSLGCTFNTIVGTNGQALSLLASFSSSVKRFLQLAPSSTCVVTNTAIGPSPHAGLGTMWARVPHATISLQKDQQSGILGIVSKVGCLEDETFRLKVDKSGIGEQHAYG
eukprot:m.75622 g.75622  ORF g.75622 m.75622 type:complete len:328 (-) comp8488_c0_seq1:2813-3796(-)